MTILQPTITSSLTIVYWNQIYDFDSNIYGWTECLQLD